MKIKTLTVLTLGTITIFGCATNQTNAISQQDDFLNAAKISLANNNPVQAIADTNKALEVNGNSAQAYAIQASAYQQLNNNDQAELSFKKSLAVESSNTLYRTSYANFLCNNGSYNEAEVQYQLAADRELNKTPQSIDNVTKAAQIYSSAGDCSVKQNNLDAAIENYESSINTKNAPQQTYISITNAYLAQNNYPKAALYISSYPGDQDTAEVLKIKIKSLTGLMNSNYQISDNNRKLLKAKIDTLNQKLAQLDQNGSTSTVAPTSKAIVATSATQPIDKAVVNDTEETTTKPVIVTSSKPQPVKVVAATTEPNNNIKSTTTFVANKTPLNSRIKKATNGRSYIVVEQGDTLFNIAQRSGVTQNKIIEINHLKNQYVPLGTKLYLD